MPVGPYETFAECVADQIKIYRKKHPDWTEEHLREVAGGVCYKIEQQTQGAIRFSYLRPFEHEVKQGKLIAKIDAIESGVNLNRWGVTDASRRRAANTLKKAILLGPPDEDHPGTVLGGPPGAPHEGLWYSIQGFFQEAYSNGVTGGKAIIQDPYAEEKIKSGEWAAVSPSVHGLARYDDQGNVIFDDFTFQHVLFLPKEIQPAYPHVGIRDFEKQGSFEVALQAALQPFTVKEPQGSETDADMKALGIHPENQSNKQENRGISLTNDPSISPTSAEAKALSYAERKRLPSSKFAYVDKEGEGHLPIHDASHVRAALNAVKNWAFRGRRLSIPRSAKEGILRKVCRAARRFGVKSELCGTKGAQGGICKMENDNKPPREEYEARLEEQADTIEELAAQIEELQAKFVALKGEKVETPKSPEVKMAELEAKTKALETFQGAVSKREHDTLVASILETEKQAGLLADDKAAEEEKKRLDTFSNETLNELHTVHSKTAAFIKSLPPAKKPEEFDEKAQAALDDVWNTVHRQMFGHAHDKDGKEVP